MIDFFETRVENLEPKEEEKNLQQLPRIQKIRKVPYAEKGASFQQ